MTMQLALRSEAPINAVPPAVRTLTPFFQMGSRTAIQTATGSAAAIFALEGYDRRLKMAAYSLQIMNNSNSPLLCRIWAVSRSGAAELAYPLAIEVAPFSVKSTNIPVRMDEFESFERAVAELVGDGVHCTVEAAVPVTKKKRGFYPMIAAAGFVTALGVLATTAFGMSMPRISALAAPPTASTGTTVEAEYSASGLGRLSYVIAAPDGRRVQEGTLDERSGSIPIAIPASEDPGAYTLQVTMQGPLGIDKEVRVVNSVPPKVIDRSNAQIRDISVSPVVARPGQTIRIADDAAGNGGYVRLVGADGAVWAQKPFSHEGTTEFAVPAVPSSRQMRVLLRVTKGQSAAETSAGLIVAAAEQQSPAAKPAPSTQAYSEAKPDSAADGYANGTFQVETASVKSGGTIHVRILSPRNGMRLALTDTQSREITGVNVGVDQEMVALRAPNAQTATRYIVVASFTDGFGQESIVQPIIVAP
ncbi:MAG: hypothetical protein ACXVAS_14305 [Vulcanimicrobiaceae bacterium]